MARLTQLQVINKVLQKLREEQASASTNTEYTKLVSAFVAEAYEEVLEQTKWSSLVKLGEYTVTSGSYYFNLTDGTVTDPDPVFNRAAVTPDGESEIIRLRGSAMVWISVDSGTSFHPLPEVAKYDYANRRNQDPDLTAQQPEVFCIDVLDDGDMQINLYPAPNQDIVLRLMYYRVPDPLETDGTTDNTNIAIAWQPVRDLALYHAYGERGEEMGEPGSLAERRYAQSLASAMEKDLYGHEHLGTLEWIRD